MKQPNRTQAVSAAKLAAAKQRLLLETARRKALESELKDSRQHYSQLLGESQLMQARLRHLSHRILLTQEEERKYISRELHDEISQILTGINVRLATLKIEASANNGNLNRKITAAQRLVEKSVAAVHRFAYELRPAVLDDLGLIPALRALMKEFGKRTGVRIDFTSMPAEEIKQLDSLKRTVLYRIAQEALINVGKHAQASLVEVLLQLENNTVSMKIRNDGVYFNVERQLRLRQRKRLGILGMRERAEMVGGEFSIISAPDTGTIVYVKIPLGNGEKLGNAHCNAKD